MKRDMDLIRKILQEIEVFPEPGEWVPIGIDGYSPDEIYYHIRLLRQAELIDAYVIEIAADEGVFICKAKNITWAWHEFLESTRNESLWELAKETIRDKWGGVPFEPLREFLSGISHRAF